MIRLAEDDFIASDESNHVSGLFVKKVEIEKFVAQALCLVSKLRHFKRQPVSLQLQ